MVTLTLLHPQESKPLRHWRFEQQTPIRLGRAPENHVILNNPIVSRFHAELRRVELPRRAGSQDPVQAWQLINHSANGTFVNGEAIAQSLLEDDTLIQLAQDGPILRFQLNRRPLAISTPTQHVAASSTPLDPIQSIAPTCCTHMGNPPDNLFCIHCGQPIRVEKTVREYQILRVLGRGGMGTTYLVWNPTEKADSSGVPPGKLQVLKEMNTDIARIPKAQELFEREARTLKTLNHPGIPQYYDFFIENDKKYLVMELIHGRDLEKQVRQQGPVPMEQAITWMIQTCEVLEYLHSRPTPIIHRDIKPGNLLVRNVDKRIVVLDFGAVKAAGLAPGTRIGAEGYSAPEQVQGRPVIQSDLYSIGPSLVFLLTGMSPLWLQRQEHSSNRLGLDKIEGLSRRLQLVIWRATELDPANRYQTAKELIHALKNCLG